MWRMLSKEQKQVRCSQLDYIFQLTLFPHVRTQEKYSLLVRYNNASHCQRHSHISLTQDG